MKIHGVIDFLTIYSTLLLSCNFAGREGGMPEGEVLSLLVDRPGVDADDMAENASSCDDIPCNVNCDCYDCVVNT